MNVSASFRRLSGLGHLAMVEGGLVAGVLLAGMAAWAAVQTPVNSQNIRRSEHFVVYDTRRYGRSLAAFADSQNPELVQLEPATLLLSAERIQETLARQLGIPSRGGGKIRCYLYAPLRNNEHITLVSTLYTDGWQYLLQIPDDVERTKLVRALVQSLLLDLANRGAAGKSAEIPPWLLEGLTKQVLCEVGPGLIVDGMPTNSVRRAVREIRGADSLAEARILFKQQTPLTFGEICEGAAPGSAELWRRYQLSCQLLVCELMNSNHGRTRMLNLLRDLPNCWNWQTAFLSAYRFPRLLDVEKWWAVTSTAVLAQSSGPLASVETCLDRLEEVLTVAALVRLQTNALPVRTETTLVQAISEWEYKEQRPMLEQKLQQLAILHATAPRQTAPLVASYWACLRNYVTRRDQSGYAPETRRQIHPPGPLLANEAIRELISLDRQRLAQRQQLSAAGPTLETPRP